MSVEEPKLEREMNDVDACPKGNSKNRSTVATVVLGAFCVDPDGVRVVHISVKDDGPLAEEV